MKFSNYSLFFILFFIFYTNSISSFDNCYHPPLFSKCIPNQLCGENNKPFSFLNHYQLTVHGECVCVQDDLFYASNKEFPTNSSTCQNYPNTRYNDVIYNDGMGYCIGQFCNDSLPCPEKFFCHSFNDKYSYGYCTLSNYECNPNNNNDDCPNNLTCQGICSIYHCNYQRDCINGHKCIDNFCTAQICTFDKDCNDPDLVCITDGLGVGLNVCMKKIK